MSENLRILIVGCGDVGKRVANQLLAQNHEVTAISHRAPSQKFLTKLGIKVIKADLDEPESLAAIDKSFDQVFYFAPPPSEGITDPRIKSFFSNFLQRHIPKRLLYISTTGVYGNHNDLWIDESTPVNPENDRSRRRLDAEHQIEEFANAHGMEFVILRVAGIYSLEKLPLHRLKKTMKILDREVSSASNRIHAADLCQIALKAMAEAKSGEIFNVADGHPSTMSDYFIQVAELFDLPEPEEVDWEYAETHFSSSMLSYLNESKKISADKVKKTLGIKLMYPTLEEGLNQCLEEYHEKHDEDF